MYVGTKEGILSATWVLGAAPAGLYPEVEQLVRLTRATKFDLLRGDLASLGDEPAEAAAAATAS
jgi:hypothetical protein